jgi:hypothetical protein
MSTSLVPRYRNSPVLRYKRHALCNGHRLLALRFHVKADAALALDLPKTIVEYARQQHPAESDLQLFRAEVGIPFAFGMMIVVEYTNEIRAEILDVAGTGVDGWLVNAAGR